MKPKTAPERTAHWATLLEDAVNKPGVILKAYTNFYRYSFGNQLLAIWQCAARGIDAGPINTFKGWTELGRMVKKGEKAIKLCMPVTVKKRKVNPGDPDENFTMFVEKPKWFVLSQTEGDEYVAPVVPGWELSKALAELNIEQIKFDLTDGNVLGYARKRKFAVSPLNPLPHKTTFHELGHIVLGHTKEVDFDDGKELERDIREVEAECVSLICCESLGLPGIEYSRGYIQNWIGKNKIDEKTSQRIFKAADLILKAGRENDNRDAS